MQLRFKSCFVPLAGLMLVGSLAQGAGAQTRTAKSVAGELLVRWKSQHAPLVLAPSTSPSRWQQSSLQSQLGAKLPGSSLKRTFAISGWSVVKIPAGESTETARARLAKTLGAANVSLNYRRYATRTPNDPSYSMQWQWPKISAPAAWDHGIDTRDVVVAVLDSGVDLYHADLKSNLWANAKELAGRAGVDDDGNGYIDDIYGFNGIAPGAAPQDDEGHGTECAGLIGAAGNNGQGVTGINWSIKIMALKFLDNEGAGTDADAIACFEYAIKMKQSGVNLKVISNSYAGPEDNPAFEEAYVAAQNAGILQVSAAGNEGSDNDTMPQYPASYTSSKSLSVAATTSGDALAYFSNYGTRSVDLAAPGVGIYSLKLGGGIASDSGTSFSAPIVAGAAALLSSSEPGLAASALKSRLMATVDKISVLSGKMVSGGRLNVGRAITPIPYTLKGQVYRLDGSKRVAIATAKVSLSGAATASVVSDASGNYSFGNLAPGTYNLAATLKGYTFGTASQKFPLATGATTATVDFKATSVPPTYYTLYGVARNSAGSVVSGVSISLSTAPTTVLAITDSSGKYSIGSRPAGIYTLKASGANSNWTATPTSITVPASAVSGKAEVNFKGVLIDKAPPAITINRPVEGAVFQSGSQIASGTATDATGNKEVYLELTRYINSTRSYYNWTTQQWVSGSSAATTFTRAATGKTATWSLTLPNMTPANYSLRVWGRDTLGNVSSGEADSFASFTIAKATTSARSSAGSS